MPLTRRLAPLYLTSFLQRFIFWYAIEKVFMTSIGLSAHDIVTITVIFSAVTLIFNMPFGILADAWSRKGVLFIGSACLSIATLLCGLSHGYLMYVLGMSFWGLYYAAVSGTYDSVIYDTVIEEKLASNKYERYFGSLQIINSVAFVSSALLSSVVVSMYSPRQGYLLALPFALISIVPLLLFNEPQLHKATQHKASLHQSLHNLWDVLHDRLVLRLVLAMSIVGACITIISEFGPVWLVALALPAAAFGPAIAATQLSFGAAGYIAPKISNKVFLVALTLCGLVAASIGLTLHILWVVFASELVLLTSLMIVTILINRHLHDKVKSSVRAKLGSLLGSLSYLLFLPLAGIIGVITNHNSIFSVGWLFIGLMVGTIGLIAWPLLKSASERAGRP